MKKDKKVVKAHQGMAHVPKQNKDITNVNNRQQAEIARTRGPIATRPQRPRTSPSELTRRVFQEPPVIQQPIRRRRPPRISDGPLDGGGRRGNIRRRPPPTAAQQKEMDTQREINKRMRGNKVVTDNQAELQRRNAAEIKRRGGRNKLFMEQIDYFRGGRKGKRPEQIDPLKGMSSRERRRAQNAQKSEFDETNRQVRKQMGTQRKPRKAAPQPYKSNPLIDNIVNVSRPSPRQPDEIRLPTVPRNKTKPFSLGPLPNNFTMNKGGAVKKKYGIAYKKGGYVSRAEYGSVDNIKKKK